MEANTVKLAQLRIHPLITLEVCHQCLGRGFVLAVRNRKVLQERCTQCAGRGSIVTDDSGVYA